MNEIMEKTYELIDVLDKSDIIRDLEYYKNKILNNHEISTLIQKGNSNSDDYLIQDIKKELYNNSDYKKYMENYNKLFYIVMDINNRFKKITDSRKCYRI